VLLLLLLLKKLKKLKKIIINIKKTICVIIIFIMIKSINIKNSFIFFIFFMIKSINITKSIFLLWLKVLILKIVSFFLFFYYD
jgi:hypothetical protein